MTMSGRSEGMRHERAVVEILVELRTVARLVGKPRAGGKHPTLSR